MDAETHLRRNPDLIAAEMDGEIVMMHVEEGQYFGLDAVGSHIWHMLERPQRARDVIDSVLHSFEVAAGDDVQGDVLAFLEEVLQKGLIQEADT